MFDFIVDLLSDKWWTYALVLALIVFDSVFPVLPSETALIATGIIAAQDGLSVVGVAVAWAGAVIGDNVAYTIGDRPGRRLRRRLLLRRALDQIKWMRHQMGERPWIVTIARFIPAGRRAPRSVLARSTCPRGRFVAYVVTGGLLWAMFNVLLGYTGGTVFQQRFWLPLLVSLSRRPPAFCRPSRRPPVGGVCSGPRRRAPTTGILTTVTSRRKPSRRARSRPGPG